jgi:hypothetical protein
MARNCHTLHMPMEWLHESMSVQSPEDPQPDWQLSRLYYNIISRKTKGPCLKIVTNYFSKTGANDTYFFIAEICFQPSR